MQGKTPTEGGTVIEKGMIVRRKRDRRRKWRVDEVRGYYVRISSATEFNPFECRRMRVLRSELEVQS